MNRITLNLNEKDVEVKVGICIDVRYFDHDLDRDTFFGGRLLAIDQLGGDVLLGLTRETEDVHAEVTRTIWTSDILEIAVIGPKWHLTEADMSRIERWGKHKTQWDLPRVQVRS